MPTIGGREYSPDRVHQIMFIYENGKRRWPQEVNPRDKPIRNYLGLNVSGNVEIYKYSVKLENTWPHKLYYQLSFVVYASLPLPVHIIHILLQAQTIQIQAICNVALLFNLVIIQKCYARRRELCVFAFSLTSLCFWWRELSYLLMFV